MNPSVPLVSPDDQKVTFVELFFDLVFVFCVTQVVGLLHGHLDLRSVGASLLVFWLIWWAWTQFTWALNAANTHHPRVEAITLAATAVAFLMGVGIPSAFTGEALWFAVPYTSVRVIGLLIYFWVARGDPMQRRAVQVFALFSLAGLIAVLFGALVGGSGQLWLWSLAIALDLVAAGVGGQQEGWNLHPAHFVERHGLIVIIALGEALIVAAAGLVGAPRSPSVVGTGVLAVAITCALWWSYFRDAQPAFEHALTEREGSARSRMARDVFSVMHFPMLYGVIAMAATTEQALAHPDRPLAVSLRLALGMGGVLFVCGTAASLWRATGRIRMSRWFLASAAAVAVLVLGSLPLVAMSLMFVMLLAVAVIEHVWPMTSISGDS
jgi:low temperature requirement protein LtrA